MIRYYITSRETLGGADALLREVRRACAAGVDWIQLREKQIAARELELLASRLLKQMGEFTPRPKLLLHSRADVALAVGADGIHLGSGAQALSAAEVRAVWPAALIGVSCHTRQQVALAEAQGADFAVFGPVFEKAGVRNPHGLELLREVCHRSDAARPPMPVLALGGVTAENTALCIDAGAAGIAGIRLFQGQWQV
ncbi:MAG: thiamine phosphate synthase [Acidobacteriaceae bacterium]